MKEKQVKSSQPMRHLLCLLLALVQLNPPLDERLFAFVPPPGSQPYKPAPFPPAPKLYTRNRSYRAGATD